MSRSGHEVDWTRFLQAFDQVAAGMELRVASWVDEEGAVLRNEDDEEFTVYFGNLYRRCLQHELHEWPELIEGFLAHLFDTEEIPKELNRVANQVLLRIGKPFHLEEDQPKPWSRPLDETDLVLNLVIDFPERMAYVTEDMVTESNRPASEWVQTALKQLQQQTPTDWCEVIDDETGIAMVAVGDSYDASRALILDRLLPETAESGCWVLPLGRDALFFLPVKTEAIPHVHLLKLMGQEHFEETPYPISNEVFWVHRGRFLHFPIVFDGENVNVIPPVEMLRTLGWVEES